VGAISCADNVHTTWFAETAADASPVMVMPVSLPRTENPWPTAINPMTRDTATSSELTINATPVGTLRF
jgi:hypothetical protein